ncbi:MAG: DUF1844 domain-containing protein [Planctomycetota bacterium]
MSEEKSNEDPKIIVDDDWKSQVEKEKEELAQKETAEESPDSEPMEIPEASFLMLLTTLSSQAMASLGLFPDPVSGKPTVNLPMAKHLIDTIIVLKDKTKGNLTEEEAAHIRDALHQLRMIYVSQSTPQSPTTESSGSSIELP